jgi:hypothetical protein
MRPIPLIVTDSATTFTHTEGEERAEKMNSLSLSYKCYLSGLTFLIKIKYTEQKQKQQLGT